MEPALVLLDNRPRSLKNLGRFAERTRWQVPVVPLRQLETEIIFFDHFDECEAIIHERKITCIFNSGINRLFPEALIRKLPNGLVGVHPGKFPAFRGSSCVEWALYHDKPIEISTHFLARELDGGEPILSEPVRITKGMDYADVRTAVYEAQFELAARTIKMIEERKIGPADFHGSNEGTVYPAIADEDLAIAVERLISCKYSHFSDR